MAGAACLRASTFEEIEADRTALPQTLATVLLSSLAAGVGALGFGHRDLGDAIFISVLALLVWAAWAVLIYEIGARIMPEPQTHADVGEMLRTIGFAAAPGVLNVFAAVPGITRTVFTITTAWALIAMIVAVRQALDYSTTRRAVVVCVLAGTLAVAFAFGIGLLVGPTAS